MGSIQDAIEDAEYSRRRQHEKQYALEHGPPLITKINSLLHYSNVHDSFVEQKQKELRDAVVIWMYNKGAFSES